MSRSRTLRSTPVGRRSLALTTALVAGGILLAAPSARHIQPVPLRAAQAWPQAQSASTPADLPDGTPYQPVIFLTAQDSVGTAPTHDGKDLRILLRRSDGAVQQLHRIPAGPDSSVPAATVAAGLLVWVENTTPGQELWSLQLAGNHAPRRITADLGDARFYQSQYDLVVADGRVYWASADAQNGTQVRSVSLSGGRVQVRDFAGGWMLTAWPWMIDGATEADGATTLRNISTGATRSLPNSTSGVTACSPTWCRLVSHPTPGETRIEIMHPDGSARRVAAQGATSTPVIADVAVLDRFEMVAQQNDTSYATGDFRLLVYDVVTRSTIEVSPDAFDVSYRAGVLWWSTGSKRSPSFLRHALDLGTV